ncbi:MAG: ribosome biogenesis GTPase YlqF [Caldicoprobacter oshimai]|uniref:Ribosome biogenesis GTPase A n=1 Tax=Caldicoprobacter faecalis TaxID=937334 RepID=A0A1I5U428_9FIRM|nr:ribosome biogenesis GTPase YlqF [Caldicoprobacter faecalis]PZN08331.1 MAG: ribosome biogenesis GTPase YlqF [Caldicoprobacter oshimai]SFP90013.1 ribosome biogenesis GTPase A [Caldicoprobacter faecalis]
MGPHIHWYPGHMNKAKRVIQESIKLVDLVIEVRDARVPRSSTNPEFVTLCKNKQRLILLNKEDLADPAMTQRWVDFFKSQGMWVEAINCLDMNDINQLRKSIIQFAEERRRIVYQQKGIYKPTRAMVVGIPNVGKSTVINGLAKSAKARVGDRPGVTRGKQWIRVHPYVEFLDTPGLLWPRAEDQTAMLHLAYIGSISDDVIDMVEVAVSFIDTLRGLYPQAIKKRYGIEDIEGMDGYSMLEAICLNQKWIRAGGNPDVDRGARQLLQDYRSGRLGALTLETP